MGANSLTLPTTVNGFCAVARDRFTRPNDTNAYSTGDLIANSTTAGSVVPLEFLGCSFDGGGTRIEAVRIRKSGTSTTNAQFRVHLYALAPTASNGDNGAFLTNRADDYLGAFDVTVDRSFTDGACGRGLSMTGTPLTVVLPTGTIIYGLLEARAAYTPAAQEVFTVILEAYRFAR